MCTALKELEEEGKREGKREGKIEGKREGKREGKIEGIVKTCKDFGASKETAMKKIQKECGLNAKDAKRYVMKYYL